LPCKKQIIIIITFLLLISFSFQIVSADKIKIFINNNEISSELSPFSLNGEIMVKSRALADILNFELKWFASINSLNISYKDKTIKMMVDNPYYQIANETHRTKNGMIMKDGSTYIPLLDIMNAFGYLVRVNQEDNSYQIMRPLSKVKEICWSEDGNNLIIEMDKLAPYRIIRGEDPDKLMVELDKAALSNDFHDNLSNKNFYLKVKNLDHKARLQLIIMSKYPIPFQIDGGFEEVDNNLIIKFLPYIDTINWLDKGFLRISSSGELQKPEITLLQAPRRMVLDIPALMFSDFDLELADNNWIKDIRVSQFKYDPVILRVVLELKEGRHLYLERESQSSILLKPTKRVRLLNVEHNNGNIIFETDNPIKADIFTLTEPDRLVINLLNTFRENNCPDNLEVNDDIVQRLRTGRFNKETVRIVADLKESTGYQLKEKKISNNFYQYELILKKRFNQIKISDRPQYTNINISLSGKLNYEIKKFSYPDRIVVDIKDLDTELSSIKLPEPSGIIRDIRFNKYSDKGSIVVRIVFELDNYYGYSLVSSNPSDNIIIALNKQLKEEKINLILLDPGHGGFDPGAIGPSGMMEKDLNLEIAKITAELLRKSGYEVMKSRDNDEFISLKSRVKMANDINARLFVSIHINSSNKAYSEGTETYLAPNKVDDSLLLAELLQEYLLAELKLVDRGVKKDNFYVIKYTNMPAVLVEIAFLSNPHEEALLGNDLFKRKAAAAIAEGIKAYLDKFKGVME